LSPDSPRILPLARPPADAGVEPIFSKIAIVGVGLIGGSIALAARHIWPRGLVIGVDEKMVLERAMVRHAIDVGADDLFVAAEADLVILAAPVRQNIARLKELSEAVTGPAVVTDVGSTKREIVAAARELPVQFSFVGGHPLGGAARQGVDFARPDLFTDRPWLFTPDDKVDEGVLDRLTRFAAALGARPRVMDAALHDRLLARISHLPQLAASALMAVIGDGAGRDGLTLSGRGLLDTTRLASSPAPVWADICATNADEIADGLDALIDTLRDVRQGLGRSSTIDDLFTRANTWRRELETAHASPKKPGEDG
jgi:prephenate dehydrogenase